MLRIASLTSIQKQKCWKIHSKTTEKMLENWDNAVSQHVNIQIPIFSVLSFSFSFSPLCSYKHVVACVLSLFIWICIRITRNVCIFACLKAFFSLFLWFFFYNFWQFRFYSSLRTFKTRFYLHLHTPITPLSIHFLPSSLNLSLKKWIKVLNEEWQRNAHQSKWGQSNYQTIVNRFFSVS